MEKTLINGLINAWGLIILIVVVVAFGFACVGSYRKWKKESAEEGVPASRENALGKVLGALTAVSIFVFFGAVGALIFVAVIFGVVWLMGKLKRG